MYVHIYIYMYIYIYTQTYKQAYYIDIIYLLHTHIYDTEVYTWIVGQGSEGAGSTVGGRRGDVRWMVTAG